MPGREKVGRRRCCSETTRDRAEMKNDDVDRCSPAMAAVSKKLGSLEDVVALLDHQTLAWSNALRS